MRWLSLQCGLILEDTSLMISTIMCFLLHLELLDQGWLETCVHVKAHPGLDQVDPWLL